MECSRRTPRPLAWAGINQAFGMKARGSRSFKDGKIHLYIAAHISSDPIAPKLRFPKNSVMRLVYSGTTNPKPAIDIPKAGCYNLSARWSGLGSFMVGMKKIKKPKYSRILLKLSGEALGGESGVGICPAAVRSEE